jgi:7-cyano-7-deazaguanine synthase
VFVVLFSGGFDSTAALWWAKIRATTTGENVRAIGFRYGQTHADAELTAAAAIARAISAPFEVVQIIGLRRMDSTPGVDDRGVSRAYVPGRNGILLDYAMMHCHVPGEIARLVVGANFDDCAAFPDCRVEFFERRSASLRHGYAGICDVDILTPWAALTKAQVFNWVRMQPNADEIIGHLRRSVSCYRGSRCGDCDACTLRARTFAAAGVEDGSGIERMHGGDPHRDAAFK